MFTRTFLRLAALLVSCSALPAQVPGVAAIVSRFGVHQPGNTFTRKDAAYLIGGPSSGCLTDGLADGLYAFQITDPECTTLLTPEALIDRTVQVGGGRIIGYLGSTRLVGLAGPCSGINLRLIPYLDTPSVHGEYKVWLTRIEHYDPLNLPLFFGFDPALSKSDNFRIAPLDPQMILRGHKFYDYDQSGAWNPLTQPFEVPVGGFRVEILRNGLLDGFTFTDQDGWYRFIRPRDGAAYTVREIAPGGFVNDSVPGAVWLATTARQGIVAANAEYVDGPEFGNLAFEVLEGAGRDEDFWGEDHCNNPAPDSGPGLLLASDPLWRQTLNTRNGAPVNLRRPVSNDLPAASLFILRMPPQGFCGAFNNWRGYLNLESHDHAGYILSREIAMVLLNNRFGFMQGTIYVDAHQDGVLESLDDLLTGGIGLLSQVGAGLTGPDDPYQDLRMQMLMCLNEFTSINESGDLSSAQVVYRPREAPKPVRDPY